MAKVHRIVDAYSLKPYWRSGKIFASLFSFRYENHGAVWRAVRTMGKHGIEDDTYVEMQFDELTHWGRDNMAAIF